MPGITIDDLYALCAGTDVTEKTDQELGKFINLTMNTGNKVVLVVDIENERWAFTCSRPAIIDNQDD